MCLRTCGIKCKRHGAWPARNRKWRFGLYLHVSADHDGPERPLEVRIHGELRKLDIAVAQSTVARYLPRPRKPPCQTLRTFRTNHLAETAAIDFFTLPTATFRFFCLRRALAPSASWTALRGDRIPWVRLVLYPVRAHFAHTHFYLSSWLLPICFLAFSRETVNTEALHLLKVMPTSSASFSSSLPATASLPRLSMPW